MLLLWCLGLGLKGREGVDLDHQINQSALMSHTRPRPSIGSQISDSQ